jgi:hypothetical protein
MKNKKKRLLLPLPFRTTTDYVREARFACALSAVLTSLLVTGLIGTTQTAVSQVIGPFIAAAGENAAGESVIDLFDENGDCMEAIVSNVSGTVGCALIDWHGKTELSEVIVTFSLGATYHIPYGVFSPCSERLKVAISRRSKGSSGSALKARRAGPTPRRRQSWSQFQTTRIHLLSPAMDDSP